MLAHVARDGSRVCIEATAGGKTDDDLHALALIKFVDAGTFTDGDETDNSNHSAKNSSHVSPFFWSTD
jgi:hypothetical protein